MERSTIIFHWPGTKEKGLTCTLSCCDVGTRFTETSVAVYLSANVVNGKYLHSENLIRLGRSVQPCTTSMRNTSSAEQLETVIESHPNWGKHRLCVSVVAFRVQLNFVWDGRC